MARPLHLTRCLSLLVAFGFSTTAVAQTADDVRNDVLAALSTPLPITIVGPLLTRDVVVTQNGDAFDAVIQDTTIMGLFPFGDVGMTLTPIGDDLYRVSDMTFPTEIEIPGLARLTFADMGITGTWSTRDRSYSDLTWSIDDLTFTPLGGSRGSVSIGQLALNVVKEPDDTDTESRFVIDIADLAVLGLGAEDVRIATVQALLAANGERPVDLYSVIREAILRGMMQGGGGDLMSLGQSLLGNTYSVATLALSATGLDIRSTGGTGEVLTAATMNAEVTLSDVTATDWGGAEIRVALGDVNQRELLPEAPVVTLGDAALIVRGADLPVADMLTAVMLLADPPRNAPVPTSVLIDGLLSFGALEIASTGTNGAVESVRYRIRDGQRVAIPEFASSYDSWNVGLAISGLNENQGRIEIVTETAGGVFEPREAMPPDAAKHIEAWFPVALRLHTSIGSLNEGLLKRLLADVDIADLNEPAELILPAMIYAAAAVFDVGVEDNHYETGLFRLEQSADLRAYPADLLNLLPYTGTAQVRMTGMDNLKDYFADPSINIRDSERSAVLASFSVLANLAESGADGALNWTVSRADINTREIEVNGITLRYPDIAQIIPMVFFGTRF